MTATTELSESKSVKSKPTVTFEQRRAFNFLGDVSRAIGAYSCGDRSTTTMRTIAQGKQAFDAVGWNVSRPQSVSKVDWPAVLDRIASEFSVDSDSE